MMRREHAMNARLVIEALAETGAIPEFLDAAE